MVNGKILVEKLIKYAQTFLHLKERDVIYFKNLLLREFKLPAPYGEKLDLTEIENLTVPDTLVKEIEDYALENNLADEFSLNRYSTYVLGLLSPLPSKVNEEFNRLRDEFGAEKACEYLYDLSVKNNYVQKTAISKNLKWEYKDGDKYLEITVNLSKPEKSNKEIAKLLSEKKSAEKYPACLLCKENEGFEGTLSHPARENIRTISLKMGGQDWFFQYSPYAYYNEHVIAINTEHTPMCVDKNTVDKLLDFVDYLPNYMIGSNASLPIVGGSILNHEHYQGGEHLMPMHNAPVLTNLKSNEYKDVKVGIVDWYNSVIRLQSKNRSQIRDLAGDIVEGWKVFDCPECFIYSNTNGTPHNASSPIARKRGDEYVIDIILRNNVTTEEYPEGLFHAHPEYHNIKREGIGLIEAMGLFILPGRLKEQLKTIAEILCKEKEFDKKELSNAENPLSIHFDMINSLVGEGYSADFDSAYARVVDRVNTTCKNILFNTSVFKKDAVGNTGFLKFLESVKIYKV